jgi:tetratricopeptide (TPR) repeat protein
MKLKPALTLFFVPALALSTLLMLSGCTDEAEPPAEPEIGLTWYDSADEAMEEAQRHGDLVLLSCGAGWCPWTRLVRESLFVNDGVIESLSTYRCVYLDAETDSARCSEMGIVLYPTTVITDAYGAELGRITGFCTPEEFIEGLVRIEGRSDRLAEMFRLEETRANDNGFLIAFGRLLMEIGMYDGALIRFDRASQMDSDDRFGTLEETTYSMAECYMLAGKYKEAGRRFRIFAREHPGSERYEYATVLAGLCYERIDYKSIAREIYEDYLENQGEGRFSGFVRSRLDGLKKER